MLEIDRISWYNWNNSQRYANFHPYYSNWKFILIRSIFCLNLFTVCIYTNNWILEQRKYYIISLKTFLFVCGLISSFCKKNTQSAYFVCKPFLFFPSCFCFFQAVAIYIAKSSKIKPSGFFRSIFSLHYLVLPRYFIKPEGNFLVKEWEIFFWKKNCWFPVQ